MHTPVQVNAVADTGAMICVGGPDLMYSLGLTRSKLNKCGKLRDVADRPINVWGSYWCYIKLNGRCSKNQIYFIPSAKRCFLSLTMCKDLGLVHQDFPLQLPTIAAVTGNMHSGLPKDMINRNMHSGLPKDMINIQPGKPELFIPEKPKEIPFTPFEENTGRLKDWLMQHFSNTTFNTNRDPLPIMEGRPHHIHLKPDVVPYACQTPADVARHWEKEVKEQLDKDEE